MRSVIALVLALLATPLAARAAEPCARATFEGSAFTVCRYERGADQIRLALKGPSGVLGGFAALKSSLGADASRVQFAMNAGVYEPSRAPVGLLVQSGRQVSPLNTAGGDGNFYLKPGGVFWVAADGAVHIEETSAFAAAKVQPRWATQSGPLLVKGLCNLAQRNPFERPVAELRVAILVGSLRRASYTRSVVNALVALAPDNLSFNIVEFGGEVSRQDRAGPHAPARYRALSAPKRRWKLVHRHADPAAEAKKPIVKLEQTGTSGGADNLRRARTFRVRSLRPPAVQAFG